MDCPEFLSMSIAVVVGCFATTRLIDESEERSMVASAGVVSFCVLTRMVPVTEFDESFRKII